MDLDVDEPAAVGRGQWRGAGATAGLAVLAFARGQDDPIVAVGGQPDDLEPAVGIGHEQQRSVGKPVGTDIDAPLAGDDPGRAGRDVDEGDLRGLADVRSAEGHDRDPGAVGRPFEGVDVDAGLGQDGRAGRLRLGRRAAAARDGSVDQPDLGPATAARQEGQPVAVGRPARGAAAARLADHEGQPGTVGLDDPDLVVADEGEPAAVGRPLRVGDRLLRGGQLGRVAAAERQREELTGACRLGRVGDDAVARVEAVLARGVDRDDGLDGQVRGWGGRGGRHQVGSVWRRRSSATHGSMTARWSR